MRSETQVPSWGSMLMAISLAGVVGAGAGAGIAALRYQDSYQATVQAYLRSGSGAGADSVSQAASYAALVNTDRVLAPVASKLGLAETVQDLSARIRAVSPAGSRLITITVTDKSPGAAGDLAVELGQQFSQTVAELEGEPKKVAADTTDPADPAEAVAVPAAEVVVAGAPSVRTVSGSHWQWPWGGGVAGALIGGLAALRLRRRDHWIEDAGDIAALTGSAPLGVMEDPRTEQRSLAAAGAAARGITTNLRFVDVDAPPRILSVVGLVPDGVTSSVTVDLAIGLARNEHSVVIVEADLSDRRVRQILGLTPGPGLTSVLTGDATLDDAVVNWRERIDVLPGGVQPPNVAAVMRSSQMRTTLVELGRRYDYVLVDSAPLGDESQVDAAAQTVARTDGAVIVMLSGEHRATELLDGMDLAKGAGGKVLGTVLCLDQGGTGVPEPFVAEPAAPRVRDVAPFGHPDADALLRSGSGERNQPGGRLDWDEDEADDFVASDYAASDFAARDFAPNDFMASEFGADEFGASEVDFGPDEIDLDRFEESPLRIVNSRGPQAPEAAAAYPPVVNQPTQYLRPAPSGRREAAQREAAQREAGQREAGQREAGQREAGQREAGQQHPAPHLPAPHTPAPGQRLPSANRPVPSYLKSDSVDLRQEADRQIDLSPGLDEDSFGGFDEMITAEGGTRPRSMLRNRLTRPAPARDTSHREASGREASVRDLPMPEQAGRDPLGRNYPVSTLRPHSEAPVADKPARPSASAAAAAQNIMGPRPSAYTERPMQDLTQLVHRPMAPAPYTATVLPGDTRGLPRQQRREAVIEESEDVSWQAEPTGTSPWGRHAR